MATNIEREAYGLLRGARQILMQIEPHADTREGNDLWKFLQEVIGFLHREVLNPLIPLAAPTPFDLSFNPKTLTPGGIRPLPLPMPGGDSLTYKRPAPPQVAELLAEYRLSDRDVRGGASSADMVAAVRRSVAEAILKKVLDEGLIEFTNREEPTPFGPEIVVEARLKVAR